MDPSAVAKARARLALAIQQLENAELAKTHREFSDCWYQFLVASKNIYTTLEKGSKISPQSRQWFGAKKSIRQNDPLLQYLFHARNSEEHGLEQVTRHEPGSLEIGGGGPVFSSHIEVDMSTDVEGRPTIHKLNSFDGLPVRVAYKPARFVLAPVSDQSGRRYAPPHLHLGSPIMDDAPVPVGRIAIRYFEALIAEAEERLA